MELTKRIMMEYGRKPRNRSFNMRLYYMIEVASKIGGKDINYLENDAKKKMSYFPLHILHKN